MSRRFRYRLVLMSVFVLCAIVGAVWYYISSSGEIVSDSQQFTDVSRSPSAQHESSQEELRRLMTLPYVSYGKPEADTTRSGVTLHQPSKVWPGYQFLCDINRRAAYLIDMGGNVVHEWTWDVKDLPAGHSARMKEDGSILVVSGKQGGMLHVSWDSEVLWFRPNIAAHHEVTFLANGDLLVAAKEEHKFGTPLRELRFDVILTLTADGEEKLRWGVKENFWNIVNLYSPPLVDHSTLLIKRAGKRVRESRKSLPPLQRRSFFHLNTISLLPDNALEVKDLRFKKGNWLVCFRDIDLIAIIEPQAGEIVWNWGPGEVDYPHTPTMLDNGRILIFDNRFNGTHSRVIELDPTTQQIVWEYVAVPPESFFSEIMGSAQRLPNGNTFIGSSTQGRAFEITREGEIVWEWWNPEINEEGRRANFYRIERLEKKLVEPLLEANRS